MSSYEDNVLMYLVRQISNPETPELDNQITGIPKSLTDILMNAAKATTLGASGGKAHMLVARRA